MFSRALALADNINCTIVTVQYRTYSCRTFLALRIPRVTSRLLVQRKSNFQFPISNFQFHFDSRTHISSRDQKRLRIMNYSVLLSLLIVCWIWLPIVRCGTRPSFVSDEMIATAASVVNACQTQTGVATVDIEAVRNGQWPETRQLKCYMYCLWEQFGLVDDKRELSLNGMLTFFQRIPAYRAEVQKAISECKGIGKYLAKGDNCEYAYRFNKCYAELSPRTYYLF